MTGSDRNRIVRAGPFGCPYFGRVTRSVGPYVTRPSDFLTFHRCDARNPRFHTSSRSAAWWQDR
ncbi:hypothetical protein IEQ34_023418 [Dendrobium chrysotoxum]|uniref:Uncharacterized protein n=1 Tax=Dendrobium chrysotoxum TaxID=161865 RepID=A0AAV7FWH8_DENCH|nr:hypothetical protein IEQ34_023418 [Dendrobium chrysotoxum]